ncbi:MAG: 16S rRNA (uracil(1498)-N(3))-methyltransferase [Treponema sp.]|nr:16S rRNA (uracil(1498)-N(3))-methyltransferase [Treponema sp.]
MNLILFEEPELGRPLPKRDERAVHLVKVLRKKAGDDFDAGIFGVGIGKGRIEKIDADGSIVFSLDIYPPPPLRLPVRIAVGFPRPIQIRRLLRDLSSLGVEAIDLVGTDLGEKSYRDTKLLEDGGARAALLEGAVQSRDVTIPRLGVFAGLDKWLGDVSPKSGGALLVAADNVRPAGSMSQMDGSGGNGGAILAIGPERGWSDRERGLLESAGFLRLSMGSRALRTETACVAAAVLTLEKIGALG